ncbi:F-box family protein-related putative isoform 1 [Tripterygium wilfordii]|uniref:F-box family protein-related putative isoform 1 n=1 Tax=Tripterygium wilfordii TaxID=458696 RepID=A0A7J7C904_TRIWF|nr:putative F-box protein At4g10190 [Tripterygium wilfordii]XP_038686529.1 putative F-box protein At4g10190 [Tripterygium wilfordii]KAF5730580.1 F-box family protein-related putative isoform 1 [Tripterygium wilfordii]
MTDRNGGKHFHMRNDKWHKIQSEDVLSCILSRLPVKSVLVSKTVSKHWNKLICSQEFVDMHLRWSRQNPMYIVSLDPIGRNLLLMKGDGEVIEMIILPGLKSPFPLYVICSHDGLICCINLPPTGDLSDVGFRIFNVATRDMFLLPRGKTSKARPVYGVAFGPKINEYKVFRFFHSRSYNPKNYHQCEVYSSGSGCWRDIGRVLHRPARSCNNFSGSNHVYVNGEVFWFTALENDLTVPGSILAVDWEENFRTISLPVEVTEHSYLIELECCLSLVAMDNEDETVDIWILRHFSESSWEKRSSAIVPFSNYECLCSVAAQNSEKFFITSEHYFFYNIDSKTWRELDLAENFRWNTSVVFTYTESLLRCCGRLVPEA